MDKTDHVNKLVQVDLEPVGRRIEVPEGTTILAAARLAGVELSSICGGMGTCGSCKVRSAGGELSSPTKEELFELSSHELEDGFRYACQAKVIDSVRIDIPAESLSATQRLQVEGREIRLELDPFIKNIEVKIKPPDLDDLRSDQTRLFDALKLKGFETVSCRYPALIDLSTLLSIRS